MTIDMMITPPKSKALYFVEGHSAGLVLDHGKVILSLYYIDLWGRSSFQIIGFKLMTFFHFFLWSLSLDLKLFSDGAWQLPRKSYSMN